MKMRSNAKVVSWFSVGLYISFGEVSRMQDYFKSFWWLNGHISESQELLKFNFCQRWPYQLIFK